MVKVCGKTLVITSITAQSLFVVREWMYEVVEELILPSRNVRLAVHQSILLFDRIITSKHLDLKIPVNNNYLQMYALLCVKRTLRYHKLTLLTDVVFHSYCLDAYNEGEYLLGENDITKFDLERNIERTIFTEAERYFGNGSETPEVMEITYVLLDTYALYYTIPPIVMNLTIAAVCLSRRLFFKGNQKEWTVELENFSKLTQKQIEKQYDEMYKVAQEIHRLIAKKKKKDEPNAQDKTLI